MSVPPVSASGPMSFAAPGGSNASGPKPAAGGTGASNVSAPAVVAPSEPPSMLNTVKDALGFGGGARRRRRMSKRRMTRRSSKRKASRRSKRKASASRRRR